MDEDDGLERGGSENGVGIVCTRAGVSVGKRVELCVAVDGELGDAVGIAELIEREAGVALAALR